jgi:hypothetical protein
MINENNFQFDHKNFFNFWKTIYGFQNSKSFSEFKFFILARMFVGICHRRTFEFVGSPSLALKVPNFGIRLLESSGTRRIPAITSIVEILPMTESGNCRQNLARERREFGQIGRIPTILVGIWPENGWIPATLANSVVIAGIWFA